MSPRDLYTVCIADGCDRTGDRLIRGMCNLHYLRWKKANPGELKPVRKMLSPKRQVSDRVIVDEDDCWIWQLYKMPQGYGVTSRLDGQKGSMPAHRWAYTILVGPIPVGHELDHVCHTNDPDCAGGPSCKHRACVNPSHLEPVARHENVRRSRGITAINARKTQCIRGHEFNQANTRIDPSGKRTCRACDAESARRRRAARAS